MNKNIENCSSECQCDGPGFCPLYGIKMTPRMHSKCKNDAGWRYNYSQFFKGPKDEAEYLERQQRAQKSREKLQQVVELDNVIDKVEKAGINLDNYEENQEGLGDLLGVVFTKLGISEEAVEKWAGIGGCGCGKRKKFLNKILPFKKSEPSIAPKKKS